ncbi:MAG: hypothetical protein JSW02_08060, partial [candidate division WOR-3 bacterium]
MRYKKNMYFKSTCMNTGMVLSFVMCFINISLAAAHSPSQRPFLEILTEDACGIELACQFDEICVETVDIDGIPMNVYTAPGLLSMTDVGAPALGSATRYIALPQGARAQVTILHYETESYQEVEIAPVPQIPFDSDHSPLQYVKDMGVYGN